jgi:putative transposase
VLLRPEGEIVNRKRVQRLYREERLPVRHPGGRKRALGRRRPTETPPAANQRRNLYFVSAPDPTVPSLTNRRDGSI